MKLGALFLMAALVAFAAGCGDSEAPSVRAYDVKTGKELWRTKLDVDVLGAPSVYGGLVVVDVANHAKTGCGPGPDRRVAINERTGRLIRHPHIPVSGTTESAGAETGVTVESANGHIEGFDRTGKQLWSTPAAGRGVWDFAIADGHMFVSFRNTNGFENCGD